MRQASTAAVAPADIWQHANDALYVHDLAGRFLAVNPAATRTFGYSEEEFLRLRVHDLVEPAHLPVALGQLKAKAEGASQASPPYEVLARSKDGTPVWVEVSTRLALDAQGHPALVHGVARDITRRKQSEAIAQIVHDASIAVNEAASLEAGVQDALGRLARAADWAYAEAWFPDADGKELRLGPTWPDGEAYAKLERLGRQYRFGPGEGVQGRAWQEGEMRTYAPLPLGDEFPRSVPATAAGLTTLTVVPVAAGGRLAAVLMFFGQRPRPEPDAWAEAARKVAQQLGASVARRLEVERVRSAGRVFAASFEAAPDAMLVLDADGTPRQANGAFLALCGVDALASDPVVPLLERVSDRAAFVRAVESLYQDRSAGREHVMWRDERLRRQVLPLRSRSGSDLGVLLHLRRETA